MIFLFFLQTFFKHLLRHDVSILRRQVENFRAEQFRSHACINRTPPPLATQNDIFFNENHRFGLASGKNGRGGPGSSDFFGGGISREGGPGESYFEHWLEPN